MASGVSGTKGGGSPAVTKINNLPELGEFSDPYFLHSSIAQEDWIKQNTEGIANVSETLDSIHVFTGSYSHEIREAQRNGSKGSVYSEHGERLEDYIVKAPQWNNSMDLHRGMTLPQETIDSIIQGIPKGKTFDVNHSGTASWSTVYKKSENFCYGKGVPVMFRAKKMTKATPIMHLSSIHGEFEVFSSKDNRFRPISAKKKNINGKQGWLIEVEQI